MGTCSSLERPHTEMKECCKDMEDAVLDKIVSSCDARLEPQPPKSPPKLLKQLNNGFWGVPLK